MIKSSAKVYLFNVFGKGYYYSYGKNITMTPFCIFKYEGLKGFISFHTQKSIYDYKVVICPNNVFVN